jgi:hypothetical protein
MKECGFYIVTLGERHFDVCVTTNGLPVFARSRDDSLPIPWEHIERGEGYWLAAELVGDASETEWHELHALLNGRTPLPLD